MRKERNIISNMNQTINKDLLFQEFSSRPFGMFYVNKYIKFPNETVSYPTTRSAFVFPISGKALITFDNHTFETTPNTVIHGCPQKQLTFQVLGDEPFCHINLYYSAIDSSTISTDFMNSVFQLSIHDHSNIIPVLNQLSELNMHQDLKSKFRQNNLVHFLMEQLFLEQPKENKNNVLIEDAITYIQQNYASPLTLSMLAEEFQMTGEQLSYQFHKCTGIRPIDYLIQYRLERAANMLEHDCSVKDTAAAVGYPDAFYFSRLFKKHFGISPSDFKKGLL